MRLPLPIEQLEAGHSDALTAYLDAMSRFHTYSFGNILEIARQRPTATRVAGLYAWNQLGRKVKKGERGIRILAPIMGFRCKNDKDAEKDVPGQSEAEEFSTLVHEIAHEMLHKSERRTTTTKTVRETEAEAVAFVVGKAIGLTVGTASADYIQLYHGNASLLIESLEVVQKTAAVILAALESPTKEQAEMADAELERVSTPQTPLRVQNPFCKVLDPSRTLNFFEATEREAGVELLFYNNNLTISLPALVAKEGTLASWRFLEFFAVHSWGDS